MKITNYYYKRLKEIIKNMIDATPTLINHIKLGCEFCFKLTQIALLSLKMIIWFQLIIFKKNVFKYSKKYY